MGLCFRALLARAYYGMFFFSTCRVLRCFFRVLGFRAGGGGGGGGAGIGYAR